MWTHSLKRDIDYLRISVTDRCNLRCRYCLPRDGIVCKSRDEILSFEEIARLAEVFAALGVRKLRLTGGEPLVRKGIIQLIKRLNRIEAIEDIALTTNGTLLAPYAAALRAAGAGRINISLDTLQEERFEALTGSSSLVRVLEGIRRVKQLGFQPLKLNMVVMQGINDDEILDFCDFSFSRGLILRFIEFMKVTPLWQERYYIPIEKIKAICERKFKLTKIGYRGSGPAIYYRAAGAGMLGFINTAENNCRTCTRLRLTSTGELKNCLYERNGLFLRKFLRQGYSDNQIAQIIKTKTENKQDMVSYRSYQSSQLYMCSIGG